MSYKHDWGMKTHLNDLKNSKKNILSIFELFNIFKIDFEINKKPANFEVFENLFFKFWPKQLQNASPCKNNAKI